VDGTGSGSCPMSGFVISGAVNSGSELLCSQGSRLCECMNEKRKGME
jgi:hypothetical protein